MKLQKALFALALSLLVISPQAAMAQGDLERNLEDDVEQVIPPAVVDHTQQQSSEPIDFDSIVITNQTPADQFVSATTPLVVALMLGSVGLVVYTLIRGDKFD